MNVVVVRENEEDLYAGIEHRQTDQVVQCLKLITRPGCERIVRHAFEYARQHGRSRVTCMVKDNIMKMSDGLFYEVFEQIGSEYPEIERERLIVDIGAARLATRPGRFDVIVTPNLYGDILSDVAAELAGGIGLAGSANIGPNAAMFEAIHGSAPDIAGKGIANPSGLLLSAVMMLVHLRQPRVAELIHNAWLSTLESGVHTPDLQGSQTRRCVGTEAFADAVIERLGKEPQHLAPVRYASGVAPRLTTEAPAASPRATKKSLVGVDVFIDKAEAGPQFIGELLRSLETGALELKLITNRGVKVWPDGLPETFCTDHWRCRFMSGNAHEDVSHAQVLELLGNLTRSSVDVIKTENLYSFDGAPGFTLGQGQ
jgi:isocitrate dehydrogenase